MHLNFTLYHCRLFFDIIAIVSSIFQAGIYFVFVLHVFCGGTVCKLRGGGAKKIMEDKGV